MDIRYERRIPIRVSILWTAVTAQQRYNVYGCETWGGATVRVVALVCDCGVGTVSSFSDLELVCLTEDDCQLYATPGGTVGTKGKMYRYHQPHASCGTSSHVYQLSDHDLIGVTSAKIMDIAFLFVIGNTDSNEAFLWAYRLDENGIIDESTRTELFNETIFPGRFQYLARLTAYVEET